MTKIGYIVAHERRLSAEERAGWAFLRGLDHLQPIRISFRDVGSDSRALKRLHVLWWHFDESTAIPEEALCSSVRQAIGQYVEAGGSLFLTLLAAPYVVDLGFEDLRPNVIQKGEWKESSWAKDYPDLRGFAGFIRHPVFEELHGAAFTWDPVKGEEFCAAWYEATLPARGFVVAVERQYIRFNEERRIAVEYSVGRGTVLTAGAHVYLRDSRRRFRQHLVRFAANCIRYLSSRSFQAGRRTRLNTPSRRFWTFSAATVQPAPSRTDSIAPQPRLPLQVGLGPLSITRSIMPDSGAGEFFSLSGRRIFAIGFERSGIAEVWCPPIRVLNNLKIGYTIGSSDVVWGDVLNPIVEVRPEALIRTHVFQDFTVRETLFTDLDRPVGGIFFDASSTHRIEVLVTAEIDFRLMWPYSERAVGPLEYRWDGRLRAFVITAHAGMIAAVMGCSTDPLEYIATPLVAGDSYARLLLSFRAALGPDSPCGGFVFAGSGSGEKEAIAGYSAFNDDPARAITRRARHVSSVLRQSVRVTSPDALFNEGYRWALVSTERLIADTPGVGRSLLAGLGCSTMGWDGGHKVSGRPGYAWYFGRDGLWACLALLAAGRFDEVRSVLKFLGSHQDLDGKIPHEVTTSGVVHHDAADATPLYILVLGRYLRASGDKVFAREAFPTLRRALSYCYSIDTDGDHLIENAVGGHGWIEGGALFPAQVELYLAACWGAALEEAAFTARTLGMRPLAARLKRKARLVTSIVRDEFWNEQFGHYNFAKRKDGSFASEETALQSAALCLGMGSADRAERVLESLGSNAFSTDWGVRMLDRSSPLYDPTGYHYGSVWPLFTGWTSLAEFAHFRPVQAFAHLMSTLQQYAHFAAGVIDEVLHGEKFAPQGVCPNQAWSETMVLHPLLEGMLGISADALKGELFLRPYLPPHWQSLTVENIRIGPLRVSMTIARDDGQTAFRFAVRNGRRVKIVLRPVFPPGTCIRELILNGRRAALDHIVRYRRDSPFFRFTASRATCAVLTHSGGIDLLPPVATLVPHQESSALRIISERWGRDRLMIEVEGWSGREYEIELFDPDRTIARVHGAEVSGVENGRMRLRLKLKTGKGFVRERIALTIRKPSSRNPSIVPS